MQQYIVSFLLGLLLLSPFAVSSQNSNFVTYTIEEGLIMSQVEALTQDNEGNLWVGTIGGLSKYNGVSFINYTQKDGLAEDWITVSFKDKAGNIWFGHWGGGISLYSAKDKIISDLELEDFSTYKLITSITEDSNGKIWFGTENGGVFNYDPQNKKAEKISTELPSNFITALYANNNQLWIGTDKGIALFDISSNKVEKVLNTANGLTSNFIKSIIPALGNEVWIGTANAGIIRLKQDDLTKKQSLTTANGLPSNNIKTLYEGKNNTVWIGSKDKGITQFIPENYTANNSSITKGTVNTFSNKFEQKYYQANVFIEDREGNIWMGTDIGLNKYMGELFRIYNQNDGLINNLVWSILPDSRGNIWMGTSEGLSKFSFPVTGGKKQFNAPIISNYTTEQGLPENIVIAMHEDDIGKIWLGTENNGLAVLSGDGKVLKTLNTSNGLNDNKIFTIASDDYGNVWVGTRKGASQINMSTYEVTNFTKEDGLGGDKVYKIYKDADGALWLGILGGDLTKFDNNKFKTYTKTDGVPQKFILSVTEDKSGNIWFCTYGNGIIKYDGSKFKNFTINEGLSANSPHFITVGEDNSIWIGQDLGIEKYDQKEDKFTLYGRKQGFLGMETNENAVANDNEGNIWFGTIRGAVKFNPKKDVPNKIEPLTRINNFQIYLQDAEFPEDAKFAYDQTYLTFEVLGVSLTNPSEVRYKYFLEGLSKEWTPTTKDNSFTYPTLPPGNYTFKAKASNNSGVWNETPVTYSFTVTPPWWETIWARTLGGLLILTIIIVIFLIRVRSLKQRQAFLESEVDKRTKELREEKEIVEQKNVEIAKQNENIRESIGYAKRIQEAILPPMEEVKESLPNSFILYQPKDIVSGDFYWIHQEGDSTLFAAVDCTGHGVPGAFMSIVGHSLLDKVVKEHKITEPGAILNQLSVEVAKTLRQKGENVQVKDGMDLAICAVNKKKKELQFAGAYNPLYLVRDGEVQEIKSDKIPIGKGNKKPSESFNNQKMDLKEGDTLYIFSDGYADQKGGPKKKKFFYPPFRKLLVEIHQLPMEEQRKKLSETITEWRGDIEQYDDMLVFGVKV